MIIDGSTKKEVGVVAFRELVSTMRLAIGTPTTKKSR